MELLVDSQSTTTLHQGETKDENDASKTLGAEHMTTFA